MKRLLLLVLLLAACLGHGHWPEAVSDRPTGNARRIEGVTQYLTHIEWEQSPYWRLGDFFHGPVFVVVTNDHSACIVPGEVWAIAHRGDYVTCTDHWRFPR